jgi:hypothetical protein
MYRAPRGVTLFPVTFDVPERFARLVDRYAVDRIDVTAGARDIARMPRQTLADIPPSHLNVLRPADEHGFRRAGDGQLFYGAHPQDVTPSGARLVFLCASPFRRLGDACSATSTDRPAADWRSVTHGTEIAFRNATGER